MIDNKLYEYMTELLKRTPLDFVRYKYDEINWNGRLVGIVGPRGVGNPPWYYNISSNPQKDTIYMFLPTISILPIIP